MNSPLKYDVIQNNNVQVLEESGEIRVSGGERSFRVRVPRYTEVDVAGARYEIDWKARWGAAKDFSDPRRVDSSESWVTFEIGNLISSGRLEMEGVFEGSAAKYRTTRVSISYRVRN